MKKFILNDGKSIDAANNTIFLDKLNRASYFGFRDDPEEFMEKLIYRIKIQTGAEIQYVDATQFVNELHKLKLITDIIDL